MPFWEARSGVEKIPPPLGGDGERDVTATELVPLTMPLGKAKPTPSEEPALKEAPTLEAGGVGEPSRVEGMTAELN